MVCWKGRCFHAGTSPATSNGHVEAHQSSQDMYLYQAADGQWVFLNPLDMRALLGHYGSYEACPSTLTAPLLELEEMTQEEHTRRRLKFLAHLPLGGEPLLPPTPPPPSPLGLITACHMVQSNQLQSKCSYEGCILHLSAAVLQDL